MKVKTSELSGKALLFAVRKAIGHPMARPPKKEAQIANCRAVVSAKLGDEVEIPDELMEVRNV